MITRRGLLRSGSALTAMALLPVSAFSQTAGGQRVLTLSTTDSLTSAHPVAQSTPQLYSIWSQVYGTFTRYDYLTKTLQPLVAKSWTSVAPDRWRIELDQTLVRHDGGGAPTARDAIHALTYARDGALSQQQHLMKDVIAMDIVDDYTFDMVTSGPFALLPSEILSRLVCFSADLHEEHGDAAFTAAPYGWGPYKLETLEVGVQIVLRRHDGWPTENAGAADVVIFRLIAEPEQRVTALLNNEIQIARAIPPHMIARLNQPGVEVLQSGGLEYMFLGMNLKHQPWDNPLVRKAVAHGVNRQLIVDRILNGMAQVMDSAVGANQDCYQPAAAFPAYDPDRARALLAEAGYANGGPEIDFYTASGRYTSDRQIGEAVAQMLGDIGFKVTLHAPDFANLFQMIRGGDCPFYYMGRGSSNNSLYNLPQFFETGGSPRINYSNPVTDELFAKARSEFDDDIRCKVIGEISEILVEDSPALFMWTHNLIQGVRQNVTWQADANGEVWLIDVQLA